MTPLAVTITNLAAVPTLVIRRAVRIEDLSQFVPAACGSVWGFLRSKQLRGGRNVALYRDDGIVEAGVEFDGVVEVAGDVTRSSLPAGRAATTLHRGPYGTLGNAHRAVREWCRSAGHALDGASWEIYGHWREAWNADPAQIETEVYCLLAPG